MTDEHPGTDATTWLVSHRAAVLRSDGIPDPETTDAIADLLARYTVCYDSHDVDGVVDVFAEDAVYVTSLGHFAGHEQIRGNFDRLVAAFGVTAHAITNLTIRMSAPDAASSWCYMNATVIRRDGMAYAMVGEYQDQLVRGDSGWRIARRDVTEGLVHAITPRDLPSLATGSSDPARS